MAPHRPTYGIRRGAICKTAGSHLQDDTSSHTFGHDQTAHARRGVLRKLSCTHLGLWGFGKKLCLYQKVIACLHQKKREGSEGETIYWGLVFGLVYYQHRWYILHRSILKRITWIYICFILLEKSYDLTESLKLINISSFSRVFI